MLHGVRKKLKFLSRPDENFEGMMGVEPTKSGFAVLPHCRLGTCPYNNKYPLRDSNPQPPRSERGAVTNF